MVVYHIITAWIRLFVERLVNMSSIERYDISEEWAHSGIIKAGDFCYLSYCVGNIGGTIEEQINGAFDQMKTSVKMANLLMIAIDLGGAPQVFIPNK